ncbi:MAG TPA: M20/M25/M40 family metallo-hydrolase [Solirubrobacteraceae bacterium]|nr:M20/M25/M40 family metallo-hydrolase [Solirubrobacteraceae bacterium]
MERAKPEERERLNALFAELCAIPSPSGQEAACSARVRAELEGLGLAVEEDAAGNLLARVRASGDGGEGGAVRTVLLCAHLDTVPHGDTPIEPVLVDDGWENAHDAILGADNKAAVAVMLVAARRAVERGGADIGLELLFTTGEETALLGAKEFDASKLTADFGYVFDHATPIGEIVVASPTYFKLVAEFHGQAAHAGIRPEDGRNAITAAARAIANITSGRIDDETTTNVAGIEGGRSHTNIVPDNARFWAEARSLDPRKAEAEIQKMVGAIHEAANHTGGGAAGDGIGCDVDVDVDVEKLFVGFRTPPDAPELVAAERALRAAGYEPSHITTGGGSDANALQVSGFPCICLANGTERNHEPTERVSVAALEGMLDVTFALMEEAAT